MASGQCESYTVRLTLHIEGGRFNLSSKMSSSGRAGKESFVSKRASASQYKQYWWRWINDLPRNKLRTSGNPWIWACNQNYASLLLAECRAQHLGLQSVDWLQWILHVLCTQYCHIVVGQWCSCGMLCPACCGSCASLTGNGQTLLPVVVCDQIMGWLKTPCPLLRINTAKPNSGCTILLPWYNIPIPGVTQTAV